MPDASAVDTSWIQTGGLALFASAVLVALRDFKKEFSAAIASFTQAVTDVNKTMSSVRELQAALLERERARAERLAAKDAAVRSRAATPVGGVPEAFDDDPETAPIAMAPEERPRARTNPGAYSIRGGKTSG